MLVLAVNMLQAKQLKQKKATRKSGSGKKQEDE